jgi:hypothetical protein
MPARFASASGGNHVMIIKLLWYGIIFLLLHMSMYHFKNIFLNLLKFFTHICTTSTYQCWGYEALIPSSDIIFHGLRCWEVIPHFF